MSSIILTHWDCDGICSAAIAKRAIEDATVIISAGWACIPKKHLEAFLCDLDDALGA